MANLDNEYKILLEDIQKKLKNVQENQNEIKSKMSKIENVLNHIKQDIYCNEDFDFEIVCPYCEHEFVIEMKEDKKEVQCPECKNMIELDWSGDLDEEDCLGHHCSGCQGCNEELDDDM